MTRAAEILHVSQPTLSKELKMLEQELGKKLFTRSSFSIHLTQDGILLRDRAADLIGMADRIKSEFLSMEDITGGEIYLGLAESYQISYLAKEIKLLKDIYPALHYHVTSGDTEQVIDKLDKGLLDFAVLAEFPNLKKYNALAFPNEDTWGLVMPAGSQLATKDEICFDDLIGLPLLCSRQAWDHEIARWCGERFNELSLAGSFKLMYNGAIFVKEGLGYLLSFDKLVDTSPESDFVFRKLTPRLTTKLFLVWRKSPGFSPIAERLLERLKRVFLPC